MTCSEYIERSIGVAAGAALVLSSYWLYSEHLPKVASGDISVITCGIIALAGLVVAGSSVLVPSRTKQ